MSDFHLEFLNRNAYIASIKSIQDTKSIAFANMSLRWWDKLCIWQTQGCVVLADAQNNHLSYIFYKIDRYKEYMTIHNIFTPLCERRKGYAQELLRLVFDVAIAQQVSRFKLSSISQSLDFYLSLGFVYWGLTPAKYYYCDLPMPPEGLDDLDNMMQTADVATLYGKKFEAICAKVNDNHINMTLDQQRLYRSDKIKMQEHYMLDNLLERQKI